VLFASPLISVSWGIPQGAKSVCIVSPAAFAAPTQSAEGIAHIVSPRAPTFTPFEADAKPLKRSWLLAFRFGNGGKEALKPLDQRGRRFFKSGSLRLYVHRCLSAATLCRIAQLAHETG